MASNPASRVIVVTGANRGIGYGIVRRTAAEYHKSYLYQQSSIPLKIYLTSRDVKKGQDALEAVKAELKGDLQDTTILHHQLDLSDNKSKDDIVKFLQDKEGGVDVLINNAGIALDGFDASVVEKTISMNYFDVTDLNERFLPILRPQGRIVTLASMAGMLNGYSSQMVDRFHSVSSKADADALAHQFVSDAKQDINSLGEKGWKQGAAYSVAKACLIAYHRARANELQKEGSDKLVNCCCPGYVSTDMTKHKGYKTVEQGAMTPVMLALEDLKGRSGGYFQDEIEKKW